MTRTSGSSGGGQTVTTDKGNKIALPTPAYAAPAGASLGQSTTTGGSLISTGQGRAYDTATGSLIGTATGTRIVQPGNPGQSLVTPNAGGQGRGGELGTTIKQPGSPANENAGGKEPKAITTNTQVGPSRNPALSTNFLSIVGGAGNLGRRGSMSKRTLIGGA